MKIRKNRGLSRRELVELLDKRLDSESDIYPRLSEGLIQQIEMDYVTHPNIQLIEAMLEMVKACR